MKEMAHRVDHTTMNFKQQTDERIIAALTADFLPLFHNVPGKRKGKTRTKETHFLRGSVNQ